MEDYKEFKIKPILGVIGNTEWWTEKDWKEHQEYVDQLKKEGKYLTEGEELTFIFKPYTPFIETKTNEQMFSDFRIIMPDGEIIK